jgi:hypothetical protein
MEFISIGLAWPNMANKNELECLGQHALRYPIYQIEDFAIAHRSLRKTPTTITVHLSRFGGLTVLRDVWRSMSQKRWD